MNSIDIITMDYAKSTKNTHVYHNDTADIAVPTIYIKRSAFTGKPPQKISLQIASTE